MANNSQGMFVKGIYEFEDPSGCLIVGKVPATGTVDLYRGTVVVVRPNQCALFIYKGEIADVFLAGTHELVTGNIPLLTRLSNFALGFKSPLRCELWFFTNQVFTGRRWGTAAPIIQSFEEGQGVPIRAFGNYNITLVDPKAMLMNLLGAQSSFDISQVEDLVQGQLVELLPEAMSSVKKLKDLNKSQDEVSNRLQHLTNKVLVKYGVKIVDLQVLSMTPSKEILKAMDAKTAMELIGDKREYLLYRAANSLDQIHQSSGASGNDPMQMMMGLMLGKSLLTSEAGEGEREVGTPAPSRHLSAPAKKTGAKTAFCPQCGASVGQGHKFCSSCGGALK